MPQTILIQKKHLCIHYDLLLQQHFYLHPLNATIQRKINTTHKSKVILRLKKTANVRICVIDLSKVIMCYFHYGYTKFKYGNNSRLLFTDVDSWTYEIKTKDVYEDYSKDNEMLYFSN